MKKLTLAWLLLTGTYLQAQTKTIDSLKAVAQTQTGERLSETWNQLAYLTRSGNIDTAMHYIDQSLALCRQNGFLKGEAGAMLIKGFLYSTQSKFELELEYCSKALSIAQKIGNDSLIGYAKAGFGGYHYNKNNFDLSIQFYLEAIRIFERIGHPEGIIKVRGNMAMVYQLQGKLDRAEKLIKENLAMLKKYPNDVVRMNTLHTLANIYGMQGNLEAALQIDREGLKIANSTDSKFLQSQFYDNMANCYMYSNRFDLALEHFNKCLVLDSAFGNKKQMADTYLNLGNLFFLQKKYPDALGYLQRSVLLSDETGYRQAKFQSFELLSEVYQKMGNSAKAFEMLKASQQVKDSITNIKTETKIAELETVYANEKKEQQLQLKEVQISRKNNLILAMCGLLVLLVFVGWQWMRKRKLQDQLKLQQAVMKEQDLATQAILAAEEKERQRIASDLHDGVGQMMSAAKMNLSAFEQDIPFNDEEQKLAYQKVMALVDESCREIRDISHQMMPNALLKNGLTGAIKTFIDQIDQRVIRIHLHTEGLNEKLNPQVETILYRVIQECVNNVIKHSGADQLHISLIREETMLSVTIEDNGKGFDTGIIAQQEGLGMKNIQSRVQFLKGTVEIDSTPGKGTLVAIHLPL